MSKLMTNKKMSPVAKMIWWAFGIAIMMYVILMVAGVGEKSLNEWIQLPLIVSFAGLVFTVNWRQLNRSLSKPAIILGIIFLTSLIVPNIYSFVQGFIQGMAE